MKIVVLGGGGLIGSKTVARLRAEGHDVLPASPRSGVNAVTGQGLAVALAGAQVVLDVTNPPSFDDDAILEFFETSGRNLIAAEDKAGVKHHVVLSVVGADRLPGSGYMRGKLAQETLVRGSGIPHTVVRSTQFLEFLRGIANSATDGNKVRLAPALFQPIAADDVAQLLTELVLATPSNGIIDVAGPERARFDGFAARYLSAIGDPREVVTDPEARYFGARVEELSLVPLGEVRLGHIGLDEWLRRAQAGA